MNHLLIHIECADHQPHYLGLVESLQLGDIACAKAGTTSFLQNGIVPDYALLKSRGLTITSPARPFDILTLDKYPLFPRIDGIDRTGTLTTNGRKIPITYSFKNG